MRLPHTSSVAKKSFNLEGRRALIITTSQATLDKVDSVTREVIKTGKPTGVYASEMTEPYYVFKDAGMNVDIASILGGNIPIEKLSLRPLVRTAENNRFLKDDEFQNKVQSSVSITDVNIDLYNVIFIAGGWGAAYDLAQSEELARKVSSAYASKKVIGAVCHGPLGLTNAIKPDGSSLVEGVNVTGVTNKQLKELMVGNTPKHPETELRSKNALYQSNNGLIDMFKSLVVVDHEHRIVTGQNQKCGVETAQSMLQLLVDNQSN